MARGINKAILIGNLGNDPGLKYTAGGSAVANLTLATSEQWKDKETGEQKEKTEWHRVVAFGKLAEIIGEYCKKGGQVYIEGKLQTRKWQDKEGVDRYTTEIIAEQMQLLGGRPSSQEQPAKTDKAKTGKAKQTAEPEQAEFDDDPF